MNENLDENLIKIALTFDNFWDGAKFTFNCLKRLNSIFIVLLACSLYSQTKECFYTMLCK